MAGSTDQSPPRLSRLELLGAWLGLWTPPRGAVIPPVPWRRIVVVAVAGVMVLAGAALLVLPRAAEQRAADQRRAERAAAERHSAFLRSVDREQRPGAGRGRRDPGAHAPRAERVAARGSLLAAARSRIERDAAGRSDKPIRGVDCEPFPRRLDAKPPTADLARARAAYDCTAVTARFGDPSTGGNGIIGIPFRLVARFGAGTFAWCRIVPLGDRDRLSHPLPAACRLASSG